MVLRCRDECLRDLASVHGSYRSVQETDRALVLIGDGLTGLAPRAVTWLLDRPVSNSGRLAGRLTGIAAEHGWPWEVELLFNPDTALRASDRIIVSSDSLVLDSAARWANLPSYLVPQIPEAWVVDLRE